MTTLEIILVAVALAMVLVVFINIVITQSALKAANAKIMEQSDAIVAVSAAARDSREQLNSSISNSAGSITSTIVNTINSQIGEVQKRVDEMRFTVNTNTKTVDGISKAFENVKVRGGIGEILLDNILADMLSPDQYAKNEKIDNGAVEFAIRLPDGAVLPIDSKFPKEAYLQLVEAYDKSIDEQEHAARSLEQAVRKAARDVSAKYIRPPQTTGFAVLFLPTEGLYAEILRRPGFYENVFSENRVIIVGPVNMAAFINSLLMGFNAIKVERNAEDILKTLARTKKEFENIEKLINGTHKKIKDALDDFDDKIGTRVRQINRALKDVESADGPEIIEIGD